MKVIPAKIFMHNLSVLMSLLPKDLENKIQSIILKEVEEAFKEAINLLETGKWTLNRKGILILKEKLAQYLNENEKSSWLDFYQIFKNELLKEFRATSSQHKENSNHLKLLMKLKNAFENDYRRFSVDSKTIGRYTTIENSTGSKNHKAQKRFKFLLEVIFPRLEVYGSYTSMLEKVKEDYERNGTGIVFKFYDQDKKYNIEIDISYIYDDYSKKKIESCFEELNRLDTKDYNEIGKKFCAIADILGINQIEISNETNEKTDSILLNDINNIDMPGSEREEATLINSNIMNFIKGNLIFTDMFCNTNNICLMEYIDDIIDSLYKYETFSKSPLITINYLNDKNIFLEDQNIRRILIQSIHNNSYMHKLFHEYYVADVI